MYKFWNWVRNEDTGASELIFNGPISEDTSNAGFRATLSVLFSCPNSPTNISTLILTWMNLT